MEQYKDKPVILITSRNINDLNKKLSLETILSTTYLTHDLYNLLNIDYILLNGEKIVFGVLKPWKIKDKLYRNDVISEIFKEEIFGDVFIFSNNYTEYDKIMDYLSNEINGLNVPPFITGLTGCPRKYSNEE